MGERKSHRFPICPLESLIGVLAPGLSAAMELLCKQGVRGSSPLGSTNDEAGASRPLSLVE